MHAFAEIKNLSYEPLLCRELNVFSISTIDSAFATDATFLLQLNSENQIAVSWWVSPKRTRSYPYARVYDSLGFSGKKATVIPLLKDEGHGGDRDFLQWDTISLMSLLGIHVIIAYYASASRNPRYATKITDQRFDTAYIKEQLQRLCCYHSSALHWNLDQAEQVGRLGQAALRAYSHISSEFKIKMHSKRSAETRIEQIRQSKEEFKALSRELAKRAQERESLTTQPKERITGKKGTITIRNYLGGYYYFTCDEIETHESEAFLVEAKHTATSDIPNVGDIKDGLLKMMLYTNLENLEVDGVECEPVPILKLTSNRKFDIKSLKDTDVSLLQTLTKEAGANDFRIKINDSFLF